MKKSYSSQKLALVVNAASRTGKRSFIRAQELLEEAGFDVVPYPITNAKKLAEIMHTAVVSGVKVIVIGGGDGTVSALVGQAAYSDITIGVLPLGTANSFSRSLNIPPTLEEAVKVIAGGKTAQIDLGKINDYHFANAVSIGFASSIADDIPHLMKRYLGILAYGVQSVLNISKFKPFTATFTGDENEKVETYQIVIANGGFYGPAPLLRKARLQSSDLSIFTFKDQKPLGILAIWLRSIAGKRFSQQNMQRILVKDSIVLKTTPKQKVSIDGEIKTETPVTISVAAGALTVLVAKDSQLEKEE